jgi:hypothetical protein
MKKKAPQKNRGAIKVEKGETKRKNWDRGETYNKRD